MARKTTLHYRFPTAVLVVSGTVRRTWDQDVDKNRDPKDKPAKLLNYSTELRHRADGDVLSLEVGGGVLWSYKSSFEFTEDLRLTKASTESSGEVGTLIAAGATLVGAVAPLVAAADLVIVEDPSRKEYNQLHQDETAERWRLVTLRGATQAKIRQLVDMIVDDPDRTNALSPQLAQLRQIEASTTDRINVLDTLYDAWHAGRVTILDDSFEFVVELNDIASSLPVEGDESDWKPPKTVMSPVAPASLQDLWERFGTTVLAKWRDQRPRKPSAVATDKKTLYARQADEIMLTVFECRDVVDNEQSVTVPVAMSRTRAFVADEYSVIEAFKLKKSLFGSRSLGVSFSANGYLSGLSVEGDAAAAGLAKAVGEVPADIGSGIDSYTKISGGITTAQQAGLQAELGRINAEVQLRQQQLVAAGLDATQGDAVELLRLQQLQQILAAQTSIRGSDPTLIAALEERAASDLTWYQAPNATPVK